LLVPSVVGITDIPAEIGGITGVSTPMISVTEVVFATQPSSEPYFARCGAKEPRNILAHRCRRSLFQPSPLPLHLRRSGRKVRAVSATLRLSGSFGCVSAKSADTTRRMTDLWR
jgi:hypothetical protein